MSPVTKTTRRQYTESIKTEDLSFKTPINLWLTTIYIITM